MSYSKSIIKLLTSRGYPVLPGMIQLRSYKVLKCLKILILVRWLDSQTLAWRDHKIYKILTN